MRVYKIEYRGRKYQYGELRNFDGLVRAQNVADASKKMIKAARKKGQVVHRVVRVEEVGELDA